MGEFGDKFRKARENKEFSLGDVSNVIKISTRMLKAIEEEHFDQLPGGVFNRGFIRAYAKHLGLDSEEAVNDYQACLHRAQVDSHEGWDGAEHASPQAPVAATAKLTHPLKPEVNVHAPVEVEELPELQLPRAEHIRSKKEYLSRLSSGIPRMRIAIALCLLISVFFFWTRHSRNSRTAEATSGGAAASVTPTTAAAAPVSQATPTSQPSAPPAATAIPSSRPSTHSAQPVPTPPAADRAPAPVPLPETSEDPNPVKVEKKDDVTIRSFGATVAPPAEQPAATLTLIVRASENSWISVTSDGQLVTQETLIAPAATSFHAARELVVRVGNAAGVSFLWNGEELPPQGAEAEAKTFIFDAQGIRTSTTPAAQP